MSRFFKALISLCIVAMVLPFALPPGAAAEYIPEVTREAEVPEPGISPEETAVATEPLQMEAPTLPTEEAPEQPLPGAAEAASPEPGLPEENAEDPSPEHPEESWQEWAFFAESSRKAQEIALEQGGELVSFQHGIGVLRKQSGGVQAYMDSPGVTLYPEYIYTVEEPETPPQDNSLKQWHLDALGAEAAWQYASGKGVLVAVIDTGVDTDHEDLAGAIARAESTIPDRYYGENEMFPEAYRGAEDQLGHGTHVAGIIGARKNNFGCTGIAPECGILSIKALERSGNQGKGRSSWVAAAVSSAIEQGADIINLSVGGSQIQDALLKSTIQKALDQGILVVCAAGNTTTPMPIYPGAYDGTLAVSALKAQGNGLTFASTYSNSGDWIDFSAPGSSIRSTVPGGYGIKSGTSMACPMVSGALALLLSADPHLTPEEAKQLLRESAQDLGDPGKDKLYGYGALDLDAMTRALAQWFAPDVPQSTYPTGATLFRGTVISLTTQTRQGQIVYTLDGTSPQADSPVWPGEGICFPEGENTIEITACTRSRDGVLGDVAKFSYSFVSKITDLDADGEESGAIPAWQAWLDPLWQRPCRCYRLLLPGGCQLEIPKPPEDGDYQLYLLPESPDVTLEASQQKNILRWRNQAEEDTFVLVYIVAGETLPREQEASFTFSFARKEIPAPTPTQPTEPTQPAPTQPAPTQPPATQPTAPTVPPRQETPAQTEATAPETAEQPEQTEPPQTPEEEEPEEDAWIPPEYEQDWLYAMEPEASTPAEEPEENPPDLRFLCAGGTILLFGAGLLLLGSMELRIYKKVMAAGLPATARVIGITPCLDSHSYRYRLGYRTSSDQWITAYWREHPHRSFVKRHPEGASLPIRYLPENPETFLVCGYSKSHFIGLVCTATGLGVIALGIGIVLQMFG